MTSSVQSVILRKVYVQTPRVLSYPPLPHVRPVLTTCRSVQEPHGSRPSAFRRITGTDRTRDPTRNDEDEENWTSFPGREESGSKGALFSTEFTLKSRKGRTAIHHTRSRPTKEETPTGETGKVV